MFKRLAGLWLLVPVMALAAGPDLVLKDLDGRDRNVNEFIGRGKWTVVAVWASDCPVCKAEIHEMTFFHDAHHKKDATVLGVSIDGNAKRHEARRFVDEQALNFPNLIGTREQMARFGAGRFIGTPTFYVFSPHGELLAAAVGPVKQETVENFIRETTNAGKGGGEKRGREG